MAPRKPTQTANGTATLRDQVDALMREYFQVLDGELPCDLYDVVMDEVELPLLRSVMNYVDHNQTRAAGILGLSRGTLRKKLKQHGIL